MISDILHSLKNKEYSSVELTHQYLNRIENLNPKLNAYLTVATDEALKAAGEVDKLIADSSDLEGLFRDKPLLGVPIGLKDIFSTKNIETTAASNILKGYIPPYDATVVKKIKDAGGIVLGKLNCDAFAHGASGENSDFGVVKNPYDLNRVAGGSSSGSGAAAAAGLSVISTGTDTGGSIRNPASFTNTVGLKPTYGRVSRYGIIAMASSLDSVGHLSKTVEDSARFLQVTAGYDPLDGSSAKNEVPNYIEGLKNSAESIKGLKIGLPKEYFSDALNSEIRDAVMNAAKKYEQMGAEIVEVSLPYTEYGLAVYYILTPSEVSSNLGRFDGIRYGFDRSKFGAEAKRRIMIGTHVLSSGYYDAYYLKAQKVRTLLINDFKEAFNKVDVLLTPVTPDRPPLLGENVNDPLKMYLMDVLSVTANLAGIPGLSVPAGFSKSGLPIGMQLLGPHFSEDLLFKVGHAFEQQTKFYERTPNL
jgi:aspartyl-tRNA(Asn)/glutamyl-tRNA(Gln) amidotransferase subunit A